MQSDEARACVAQGCGIAHIAATVNDLGQEMSDNSLVLRIWAGEGGRIWGGGCDAEADYVNVKSIECSAQRTHLVPRWNVQLLESQVWREPRLLEGTVSATALNLDVPEEYRPPQRRHHLSHRQRKWYLYPEV